MSSLTFRNRLVPIIALGAVAGCRSSTPPTATATVEVRPTPVPAPVRFVDTTKSAGMRFRHHTGAFGIVLMPETVGSGVAFIDFDGDGYQDLYFVNGRDWTPAEVEQYRGGAWSSDEKTVFRRQNPPGTPLKRKIPPLSARRRVTGALYRNNRDGTFRDVTRGSGLDIEMYGMGAAVGDYDNDGRVDLYVTGLGRNYLFRNQSEKSRAGQPRFVDASGQSPVRDKGWSTSAAWLDYDKDGLLDLFVCHYVGWSAGTDIYGSINGRDKSYTPPYLYEGEANRLFRNLGRGRFEDVTARAGVKTTRSTVLGEGGKPLPGRSLGVAVCDYNNDAWPDILVANDGDPNFLWSNNRDGTFRDVGTRSNIAYAENGHTRAGMGIDTADIDHTNQDSMAVGNFDNEMLGLYQNQGGNFVDVAATSSVGRDSMKYSIFGLAFLDIDNDGWPDLLTSSGHISKQFDGIRGTRYALRPLLFHNNGKGNFREIAEQSGEVMAQPRVGRGLAVGDYDLDGDTDAVFTINGGPPVLARNDGGNKNNAIRLTLRGTKSNRSGIGTLVKVKFSEKDGLRRWVRSGSSYLSQSELPLTLGLGKHKQVLAITLYWPSGGVTRLKDVVANQSLVVNEDKGIVSRASLPSGRK